MSFIFLILLVVLGIPLLISFITYKITKKFYPKIALKIGSTIFFTHYIVLVILIYIVSSPNEDFYKEEFKKITEINISNSANFYSKEATYPDFHGDYMSAAAIKLSRNDYNTLLRKIRKSNKLKTQSYFVSDIYQSIKNKTGNQEYIYYASSEIEDNYHFIGFCKDQKTVIIHLVKW